MFFPRLHARITDSDAVGFVPDHFAFSSKNFEDGIFTYSFDVSVWASRKDKLREWEPFVRALQLETNMALPKGTRAVYRLMFRENYEIPGQMEGPRAKFPVPEAYVVEDAKPEEGFRPAFKLMRLDEKAFSKIRPYSGESDDCEYFGTSPYREPAESPYSVPRVSKEVREALSSGKFFGKCRIPELVENVDAFESESSARFTEYQRLFLKKASEALSSGRSLDPS